MPPSPTGPRFPTASSQGTGGVSWANLSNAYVEDGNVASCGPVGPGPGGGSPNQLNLTGFGFNLPSSAIIDGIKLEIKVSTTVGNNGNDSGDIYLLYNGGSTPTSSTPNSGQFWSASGLSWNTYGGSTSLWGRNWTYSDINNANFGASIAAMPVTATATINVDAVRITVYWHTAPHDIPQQYLPIYKVYDSVTGAYLGNLPKVTSKFALSQDINTAGSQITINCGVSADTSGQAASQYTDEVGNNLTDENNNALFAESAVNPVGTGTGSALIRNGNRVVVYEYNHYYPNGHAMFSGVIEHIEANFGGDTGDGDVKLIVYSDSSDMDNHLVRGSPFTYTLDQTQTSQNSSGSVTLYSFGAFNYYGQTFTVGTGVTNLGAISLYLNGTANVTISVYASPTNTTTPLGSVTQAVSVGSPTEVQFTIPLHIPVTAGNQYFFTVTVASGQSITIYYQNTTVYAGGAMYNASFSGGSGGSSWSSMTGSLYFKTFSTNGSTVATFTSVDPSTGMLETIMNDYNAEGGKVSYNSSTIEATGLSLNYGFNTNTVYEGLQSALSVSPSGFYFYVDQGQNLLYFKQARTTADIVLTKGKHLNKITIITSIEYVVNAAYVTGAVVSGNTIYTLDSSSSSISRYGLRLQRHNDNNIPDTTTAHAVGGSIVSQYKNEAYLTTVTVPAGTMDISLLRPGLIIGFNGFGTFVDQLLAQIVHWDYTPDAVTLQLGMLPRRQTVAAEKINRGLIALNTVTNPTSPS